MKLFNPPTGSNTRMYVFLVILAFGMAVSQEGWKLLYTNFAVQVANFDAADNGFVHSIREIPGLLGVAIIPLLMLFREDRLAIFFVVLCGLGTACTGLSTGFVPIAVASLMMSIGFHYFEQTKESLLIQYYDLNTTPLVMGKMRSVSAAGCLLSSFFVLACTGILEFKTSFLIVGCTGVLLGVACIFINPVDASLPTQRKRIVCRARYWLFYLLTFLVGCRRLVFTVFALFLIVQKFGFSVKAVSMLFILNYAACWAFNPLIGKIILLIGERKLLTIEYGSAILIFLGYAFSESPVLIVFLYLVDSITFNFSIALRTFFQKIADPKDVAPSMALSQTINHIAAVFIPSVGGWMWVSFGSPSPFLAGAAIAGVSLALAQLIDWEIGKGRSCFEKKGDAA